MCTCERDVDRRQCIAELQQEGGDAAGLAAATSKTDLRDRVSARLCVLVLLDDVTVRWQPISLSSSSSVRRRTSTLDKVSNELVHARADRAPRQDELASINALSTDADDDGTGTRRRRRSRQANDSAPTSPALARTTST
jgi:hypothetical protein